MVIDTSALMAIFAGDPENARFLDAIATADVRLLSAATFLETSIVLEARYGPEGPRHLDLFLDRAAIEIVSVDEAQAREARSAYARFGKGRHPAALNFGDCFSYALASTLREPLLFKRQFLSVTNVEPART